MNLVETLGVEIGVRQTGTDAAVRAADAIAGAFRELGLEPRFQEFEFLGYDAEEPELEIDGERWPAGPCMYAHPGEVEGEIEKLSDGVWAVGEGRLLHVDFAKGAIPFLTSTFFGGHIATPPTAFVSRADAARLPAGAHARLRVGGRFVPGRRDRNVIADIPGASDEVVVVGAHFDSVWRGPGVIDNATGVEGIRRVAERLAGRELPRTVRFVAFAAEEISLLGARRFVHAAKERDELSKIVGMVNLDCIGHGEKLELLVSPAELLGRATELAAGLGLLDRYELETSIAEEAGTDHLPFAKEGIPAASILYFPYDEYHLPEERIELVDEQKLADAVDLAVALVESQLTLPVARLKLRP